MNSKYSDISLKAKERVSNKLITELNKNASQYGIELSKLVNLVPNWETYLTNAQLETTKQYLKCFNAYEVDYRLKLRQGTSYQRLFGSTKSKGSLGKLKEVYEKLNKVGYFEQKESLEKIEKKYKMSEQNIEKIRELIKLIFDLPNYSQYLTQSQLNKLKVFLKFRSIKITAEQLDVSQETLKHVLIGKDGILDILKKAQSLVSINDWDEI